MKLLKKILRVYSRCGFLSVVTLETWCNFFKIKFYIYHKKEINFL